MRPAWLFAVAVLGASCHGRASEALQRFDAAQAMRWVQFQLAADRTSPSQAAIRAEMSTQLERAIEGMDPIDREILALRHFEELTNGETAEILVLSPFAPAEGLLTLGRSGILQTERFTTTGSSHILKVKIEEGWTPNLHLQVDLIGRAAREDAGAAATKQPSGSLSSRPAFAAGDLDLSIPPYQRTLALKVTPAARMAHGWVIPRSSEGASVLARGWGTRTMARAPCSRALMIL